MRQYWRMYIRNSEGREYASAAKDKGCIVFHTQPATQGYKNILNGSENNGVPWRFVKGMAVGDRVIVPNKEDRTLLLAEIKGECIAKDDWGDDLPFYWRRKVEYFKAISKDKVSDQLRTVCGTPANLIKMTPYRDEIERLLSADSSGIGIGVTIVEETREGDDEFAYEEDLRNYLAENLNLLSLTKFVDREDEEGVEYPIDEQKRRVDILALDEKRNPVVIELKVSKGHEKVIGQCLYYKNMVKQMLSADKVRIIIIAREITNELKTSVLGLEDVELFEYKLRVDLKRVSP